MVDMLSETLPIVIYFLLIVLLIILITFGIKLLISVNKLEKAVNEVVARLEKLQGLFNAADFALDKIARFGDIALDFLSDKFRKFSKKREEIDEDE